MSLNIGIVGLPNVGKSTIFNALTRSKNARAANFPFCTIDPNVGIVAVPDLRLDQLAAIVQPAKIIPTFIEFVDIAGLVKGASQGEGLGNQFLSHIRACDAIGEIVRFFEDPDITHVHDRIDPLSDIATIESELILADLQTLENRLNKTHSQAKSGDKKVFLYLNFLERLQSHLNQGKRAKTMDLTSEEKEEMRDLHLLTAKPLIYIANLKESEIASFNHEKIHLALKLNQADQLIPICAKLEEELGEISPSESQEYLASAGLSQNGLDQVIAASYKLLDLETYFTAGPKEVRAWTIKKGTLAPQAAGIIHTDFEKGFIKAEVISYKDYLSAGSELAAKEQGLMRQEGKEYIVQDGDIIHFRFNV